MLNHWGDVIRTDPNANLIVSIAVGYYLGPAGKYALFGNTFTSAAAAGFLSGAISAGNLEGALQGAFSATAFYGAGQFLKINGLESKIGVSVAVHGVVGCVTSVAGGGQCGSGALSAAFSKAATFGITNNLNPIAGTITSAVIGGTASVLGGGQFANGAKTAAFGYLFNYLTSDKRNAGQVRARLATLASKMKDSTLYEDWDQSGNQRMGTYKCNIFVADSAIAAGADVPYPNNGPFGGLPVTAGQWADKSYEMPGWRILGAGEVPLPGDVVARGVRFQSDFTGHVGVVVGVDLTASVSHGTVIVNGFGFRPMDTNLTFRRWEGVK